VIRVTIEVLPGGDEKRKHTIAEAEILSWGENASTLDLEGDYAFELRAGDKFERGMVRAFPRTRLSVWGLLEKVLARVAGSSVMYR